jgi:hypothetical protein
MNSLTIEGNHTGVFSQFETSSDALASEKLRILYSSSIKRPDVTSSLLFEKHCNDDRPKLSPTCTLHNRNNEASQ